MQPTSRISLSKRAWLWTQLELRFLHSRREGPRIRYVPGDGERIFCNISGLTIDEAIWNDSPQATQLHLYRCLVEAERATFVELFRRYPRLGDPGRVPDQIEFQILRDAGMSSAMVCAIRGEMVRWGRGEWERFSGEPDPDTMNLESSGIRRDDPASEQDRTMNPQHPKRPELDDPYIPSKSDWVRTQLELHALSSGGGVGAGSWNNYVRFDEDGGIDFDLHNSWAYDMIEKRSSRKEQLGCYRIWVGIERKSIRERLNQFPGIGSVGAILRGIRFNIMYSYGRGGYKICTFQGDKVTWHLKSSDDPFGHRMGRGAALNSRSPRKTNPKKRWAK